MGVFLTRAASITAVGFGLLTIKQGGGVLFGSDATRSAAGDYVPFVVTFNFLAGFAYVVAGVGVWLRRRWASWLAIIIAAATAVVFAAFIVHVYAGGDYEMRTVTAMSFRTLIWVAISAAAWRGQPIPRIQDRSDGS